MSTHVLDVSGQRALTVRLNDPASTYASTPAKAGEDVQATLSGFRELRVAIPENARIQRRRYVRKDIVYEGGSPKKREGAKAGEAYETVDVEYDQLVLVLVGGTFFGRTSIRDEEKGAEGTPTYESTPHTNIVAKRTPELHFLESGELVEEYVVGEIAQAVTVELEADGGATE